MNTTGKIKSENRKSAVLAKGLNTRRMLWAVIFLFAAVTASCRFFFDTYPFGIAAVSAVSGVFSGAAALLGTAVGSLIGTLSRTGQHSYGYLTLLSVLIFAARVVVSWWLKHSDRELKGTEDIPTLPSPRGDRRGAAVHKPQSASSPPETDTGQENVFVSSEEAQTLLSRWQDQNGTADKLLRADGRLLRENIAVRMAIGALSAMFMGILSAAEGGFSYYSLFGAVFSVLMAPIFVLMIYGATERHMRLSRIREAGLYGMAAVFTYALSAMSPVSFDFGYAFVFAASVAAATSFGSIRGMVTGLLCGILLDPLYAPLFALAAGTAGLLCGISSRLAVMSALCCGAAWGIYVGGFSALSVIIPPISMASAVLLPLYHFDLVRLPPNLFGITKNVKEAERGTLAEVMHRNTSRHLTELSDSMKAISRVVYQLAGTLAKPTRWELRGICTDAFEQSCGKCPMYPTCYGAAYEKTAQLIERLTEELVRHGTASASVIPLNFTKKCGRMGRILDEINFQSARRYAALASEDKMSVAAGDYEMMSALLAECHSGDREEMQEDRELTAKLTRLLAYHDFRVGCVTAYGMRHKRIFVNDIDFGGIRPGADEIRRLFEGICGFPLSPPEFEIDGGELSMRLQSVFRYSAEGGRASLSLTDAGRIGNRHTAEAPWTAERKENVKEVIEKTEIADENKKAPPSEPLDHGAWEEEGVAEEEIRVEVTDSPPAEPCGDVITSFEADGRYYMLISDGMGSGREAALTSSVSAMFLERMLSSGVSMETALKMLNKLIRQGERECSATVDLAEIDLNTGEARFVKSGAAPSFIIRDGSIYRLQSKTVPIGIIRALDAEMIKFDVEDGDIIVMLSDGVAKSFEDCPWLLDMLSADPDILEGNVKKAAEKIVRTAAERGSADDITAGVIRITK